MIKLIIFLLLPFTCLAQLSRQVEVLFYDDAENAPTFVGANGNVANGWTGQHVNTNAGLTVSSTYARKGTYSYYHSLTNSVNDGWEWMKSELYWGFAPAQTPAGQLGANTRAPYGLRWFAFSTLIPAALARSFSMGAGVKKKLGTGERTMEIDRILFKIN